MDNADFGAQHEVYLLLLQQQESALGAEALKELTRFMRNDIHNYLNLAADYAGSGLFSEATAVLEDSLQPGLLIRCCITP